MEFTKHNLRIPHVIYQNYKPITYRDMDDWVNTIDTKNWTILLGAYANGGHAALIQKLKELFPCVLSNWKDHDLNHYWNNRTFKNFISRSERIFK